MDEIIRQGSLYSFHLGFIVCKKVYALTEQFLHFPFRPILGYRMNFHARQWILNLKLKQPEYRSYKYMSPIRMLLSSAIFFLKRISHERETFLILYFACSIEFFNLKHSLSWQTQDTSKLFPTTVWRRGLVVDTWLWDQEVPGSSLGCARLCLYMHFLTPLMCKTSTRL